MRGAIHPLPQYAFMAWCLVKHRDNFAFYLNLHKELYKSITYTITNDIIYCNFYLLYDSSCPYVYRSKRDYIQILAGRQRRR
jgi:hypothetical protein